MTTPDHGRPASNRAPSPDLESGAFSLPGALNPPPALPEAESTSTTTPATPGPTPTTNNRGNTWSFIFLLIWLFMLTNGGGDDLLVRSQYRETLRVLKQQRGNFSAWLWGEESNFALPESDAASFDLAHAVMGFGVPLHSAFASYYSNITGFVHGPLKMHNLTTYAININESSSLPSPPPIDNPKAEIPLSYSPQPPSWDRLAVPFLGAYNSTDAVERIGSWNWSRPAELALRVLEKRPILPPPDVVLSKDKEESDIAKLNESVWKDVSLMHGRVEIADSETGDELGFDLEAVHFLENGTVYGFVESAGRHVDVRDLPSLIPQSYVNATAQAIDAELFARISKLHDMIESGQVEIDSDTEEMPKANCPFVLYGQLVPTPVPLHLMQELEAEMENPTGITTVSRPQLLMNIVMMSKECGILIEVRDAEGLKSQRFWRKVTTYSSIAALVYLALLLLFIRQSVASQTPVAISRVSRWTFLTQAAADSISFVGHITFGILADGRPSMSLIAPAFFAAVLLVYEAQFSVLIHQIQQPEENSPPPRQNANPPPPVPSEQTPPSESPRMSPTPEAPAGQNNNGAPTSTSPASTTTPTPTQQPAPQLGVLSILWRGLRENPQGRLWLIMLVALTVFVRVIISPALALVMITTVYSNFWLPQIIRSVRRGTSSGLSAEYLFGTSLCRGFFAFYLFACPKNVLGIDTSPWIYVLVGFVLLQVMVILLQDYLGPAFFLPRSYKYAPKYDYHPYIPPPDTEAPEPTLGDCVICMDAIVVAHPAAAAGLRRRSVSISTSVSEKREKEGGAGVGGVKGILDRMRPQSRTTGMGIGGVAGAAARRDYALAPCHHLFHTACLERWLAIKNICPQCRRPLPPL